MDFLNFNMPKKLYPQKGSLVWCAHKGLPTFTDEDRKRMREAAAKRKQAEEKFRQERMDEYNSLDERQYIFTFEEYCEFISNPKFDKEYCNIKNVMERARIDREIADRKAEKERLEKEQYLENLKFHDEDNYDEYFYQNEPYINDDVYDINYNTDDDTDNWSDE